MSRAIRLVLLVGCGLALAQTAAAGEIDELKDQVELLKDRIETLEETEAEKPPPSQYLVFERRPDISMMEHRARLPQTLLPAVSLGQGGPSLQIRGFSHVQYDARGSKGGDSNNHFGLGGLDLFITS